MIKTLLLLFFLLINIFMFPAYGSTSTSTMEGFRTPNRQKEAKSMYGSMIMESNKPNTQRTYQGLHVVKAKTVNGGMYNGKGSHKGKKNSASSYSIKSSSLFIAALKHLIPGLLLVGYFF